MARPGLYLGSYWDPYSVILYVVKAVLNCFSIPTVIFTTTLCIKYPAIRNRRMFFTQYAGYINCFARMVYLVFYAMQLDTYYGNYFIPPGSCYVLLRFLFITRLFPLSSVIVLQTNALLAQLKPDFYARRVGTIPRVVMILCIHAIDIGVGIASANEVDFLYSKGYVYYQFYTECRFDYLNPYTRINKWYLLFQLIIAGSLFITQTATSCIYNKRRVGFVNQVANSPFSKWSIRKPMDKALTSFLFAFSLTVTVIYVVSEIVFLAVGNTPLRQFLEISLSLVMVIVPIQLTWLNQDIRRVVFPWSSYDTKPIQKEVQPPIGKPEKAKEVEALPPKFEDLYPDETPNGNPTANGHAADVHI